MVTVEGEFIMLNTFIKRLVFLSFIIISNINCSYCMEENQEHLITHTLNSAVRYIEGEFLPDSKNSGSSTPYYKPQNLHPETGLIYKDQPEILSKETILKIIKKDEDGRIRINNTKQWPYCLHGHLNITFPFSNSSYGGSAILVGPHHILTAGHNVYNIEHKEWANNVIFIPGLNDNIAPFGVSTGVKVFSFKQWVNKGDQDFDIALVTLNKPIGLQLGWAGLLCTPDNELSQQEVHVTGYPGDKGFNQLWTMADKMLTIMPETFRYYMDTFGGQSGGGLWFEKNGGPFVIGSHAYGTLIPLQGNSGTRISQGKFKFLLNCIKKTKEISIGLPKGIFTSFITEEGKIFFSSSYNGTNWVEEYHPQANWKTWNAPSVITFKNQIRLFHVGSGNFPYPISSFKNRIIYSNSSNSLEWSKVENTNDKWGTEHPISLAVFKDKLYMSHISIPFLGLGQNRVYVGYSEDGEKWPLNQCWNPHNWDSNLPTSFAVFKDRLFLAHVSKNKIFIASTKDGFDWSDRREINSELGTKHSANIFALNGKLYMVHVGTGTYNNRIFLCSSEDEKGENWTNCCYPNENWRTNHSLTTTFFNDKVYLGHVGMDNKLYCSYSDNGKDWSNAFVIKEKWKTNYPFLLSSIN